VGKGKWGIFLRRGKSLGMVPRSHGLDVNFLGVLVSKNADTNSYDSPDTMVVSGRGMMMVRNSKFKCLPMLTVNIPAI
jgi:hypothetical protein